MLSELHGWLAGRKSEDEVQARPVNYITTEDFRPQKREEGPVDESLDVTFFWALTVYQMAHVLEVEKSLKYWGSHKSKVGMLPEECRGALRRPCS